MRIEVGGVEMLSKKYESFDDLVDDFIDHESEQGRRVPSYDLSLMLEALVYFLMSAVGQQLISEAMQLNDKRNQEALEEQRYLHLSDKLDNLLESTQGIERGSSPQPISEDAELVHALLSWARRNDVDVSISLETMAEGDLESTFEALIVDLPEGSIKRLQAPKSDDST